LAPPARAGPALGETDGVERGPSAPIEEDPLPIDVAEVRRIALLARLEPERLDLETLCVQLGSILDHVARLDEAATGVSAETRPVARTRLRPDERTEGAGADEALRPAPDRGSGHFRVPRVLLA
jgi:aspartyl/glutamyl-tRNA(Asn/Gln) amidotransferase C subunit